MPKFANLAYKDDEYDGDHPQNMLPEGLTTTQKAKKKLHTHVDERISDAKI